MFKRISILLMLFLAMPAVCMEHSSLKDLTIDTLVENIERYTPEDIATLPHEVNNLLIPKAVYSTIGSAPCSLERAFPAHQASCCCSCLTADNYLITGSQDHSIKIFNASGVMQAQCIGHTGEVWSVCESHDNKIVSGSSDHTVRIWDRQGNLLKTCIGHTDEVHGVCITKENLIVSCSSDNTVRVWDMEGNLKLTYTGHTSEVWCVCMSQDNNIVSGAEDGTIRICTLAGDHVAQCVGHAQAVHVLCMSHDNNIISGSVDWSVRVWNMKGKQLALHTKHRAPIISLCVTHDNQIVSGAHDRTIRITDIFGEELAFCKTVSSPTSLRITSRNQLVAGSINGQVSFYDISPIHYLKNLHAKHSSRVWAFLQQIQAMLATGYIEKLNAFTCWARIKFIRDAVEAEEPQEFYDGLEPLVGHSLALQEQSDDVGEGGQQPMDFCDEIGFEELLNQPIPVDAPVVTEDDDRALKRLKSDR